MKITACASIIALGLGMGGTAFAHGPRPHPHHDTFYAVVGQPQPDPIGGARQPLVPFEEESHETLTGGPSGGLPGRS